ncbi:hypothetical protein BDZ97DRAFT_1807343 [Flammula alnicola]|nr:hypothetical protein BDZ97DRAFT_1807343 [Flammula alnicola]
MGPSVIVDDTVSFDFNYVGEQWTHQTGQSSVFNGTLSVCNAGAKGITPPSLTFFFYGLDINFYGTLTSGLAVNYTIDHSTVRPVTGVNLLSLQNLTDVQFHSLELLPTGGQFMLDYVTYTPNTVTPLIATSLIVDDHDTSLQYSANWNHTTGNFNVGHPYNGTMTGTGTKGSTMKFSFVGSAISVYGLLNQVDGRLSASFAVDGANATATTFAPFNGSQTASPIGGIVVGVIAVVFLRYWTNAIIMNSQYKHQSSSCATPAPAGPVPQPPKTLTVTQVWELAPMTPPSPPRNPVIHSDGRNPAPSRSRNTQSDGRNPAPRRSRNTASEDRSRAQEDGRDDDVSPRQETDAVPAPPAYEENFYTR